MRLSELLKVLLEPRFFALDFFAALERKNSSQLKRCSSAREPGKDPWSDQSTEIYEELVIWVAAEPMVEGHLLQANALMFLSNFFGALLSLVDEMRDYFLQIIL